MTSQPEYGSDVVIDVLSALGVEYVAINPGASFRGLHDSIVNHAGNAGPEMILANNEVLAVSIAMGYAKASGRPMVAMLHNVVGLLNGSMAIHGAMLDQIPVVVMGGTGPMAPEKRRPQIDWIHTALVQGNAVRDFVKWDDQPTSIPGLVDSVIRGHQIAVTEPTGPVYICVDAELQETPVDQTTAPLPDFSRYEPPAHVAADPAALRRAAELLVDAERPVAIADRVGRDLDAFAALQELADLIGLAVIDPVAIYGSTMSFPSTHPLDQTGHEKELLGQADVILGLDVYDAAPLLTEYNHHVQQRTSQVATLNAAEGCRYIDISLRHLRWRSWSQDYGMLLPTDIPISADSALAIPALLELCRELLADRPDRAVVIRTRSAALRARHAESRRLWADEAAAAGTRGGVASRFLARELGEVIKDDDWVLTNSSLQGWTRRLWDWDQPHRFVRSRSLGCGLGVSIGAALAHKGSGRLVVDIQPDGDFLYNPSGLWTAAHHEIPLLMVMYNNRSYHNDERHQGSIAVARGRPEENRVIGIRIEEPDVDFAALAGSFGVYAEGPISDPADVRPALERAARHVREQRKPALVDVVCERLDAAV